MVKGISRNVIVINSKGKGNFETVYFILKKGVNCKREDIIREANSIVLESQTATGRNKCIGRRKQTVLGVLIGVLLSSLLWLLVILIAF